MGKKTQTQSMDPMQASYIEDIVRPAADVVAGMEFEPFTGNRTARLTPMQQAARGG